jgi:hypothetical protein
MISEMSYKQAKRTFNPERTDLIKVVAIDVRIYTEQSAHDGAHRVFECSGKRHPCVLVRGAETKSSGERRTDGVWEDGLIVEKILGPVHEGINILRRGKLCGALVAHAIFPEVFVSRLMRVQLS